MRGYGQYCPIAKGAEIFATRWTPLIIRNLHLGCRTFTEIYAGAPGIPRALLSQRLAQLERAGVLSRTPRPRGRGWHYELTDSGRELMDVAFALGVWGARWIETAPADLDPYVVLWAWCRLMDRDRLPEERVVVRFNLLDLRRQPFWVLVQRPDPEVCVKHPGADEDLVVTTTTEWLAKWHTGKITLGHALHARVMEVEGPRRLVRALASWGGTSPFATVPQPVAAA